MSLFIFAAIFSAAFAFGTQPATYAQNAAVAAYTPGSFRSISRAEIELLLVDIQVANPELIKRLGEDPAMKKTQLDNIRELLAFASEAERTGLAAETMHRQELGNIRMEIAAVTYDRELNKDKTALPFATITDDRMAQFWAKDTTNREADFQTFLSTKLKLLSAANPSAKEISDEEKAQAREFYAKMKIIEKEYDSKAAAGLLPKILRDKVALQIKLQQAQYLARLYAEVVATKTAVSDQDVAAYVAMHPEFGVAAKRERAETILRRARAGEDFARLADDLSEDPGNQGSDGKLQGGLYADVPTGRMLRVFEQAALRLKPGEVADRLVESEYGFHIIKLEKALGVAPAPETYDVRHILIATTYQDPSDPAAQPVSVTTHVRSELSREKESRILSEIVARNKISVPDDFTVPGAAAPKSAGSKRAVPVRKRRPPVRRSRRT